MKLTLLALLKVITSLQYGCLINIENPRQFRSSGMLMSYSSLRSLHDIFDKLTVEINVPKITFILTCMTTKGNHHHYIVTF